MNYDVYYFEEVHVFNINITIVLSVHYYTSQPILKKCEHI